jgi:hypothetical protein
MLKLVLATIAFVSLSAGLWNSAYANLVVNPSFEDGVSGWTFSETGGAGTCQSPCTNPRTGSWAGFKNLFDGGSGTISQAIPTVPGHRYRIEVSLADNQVGTQGTVTVSFGSTTGVTATGNDTSTSYLTYTFDHVAASTETHITFGGTVTDGTFFIDDVSVIDLDAGLTVVGGTVTGMNPSDGKVTCLNKTTRQRVNITILAGVEAWDCEQAGLVVNTGDIIQMKIEVTGPAD